MIKSRFIARDAQGKIVHRSTIVEPDLQSHDAHVDDVVSFSIALGAVTFKVNRIGVR